MNKSTNFDWACPSYFLERFTNESLWSIIKGLHLKPNDRVLSICGSGDQTFAMAEYAGEVTAVDIEEGQIEFARRRLADIRGGNFSDFCGPEAAKLPNQGRVQYFVEEGRMEAIRRKIDCVSVPAPCEIARYAKSQEVGRFTKVYLSNAISFTHHCESRLKSLLEIYETLPRGGLIYVANGKEFEEGISPKIVPPVHKKLTSKARQFNIGAVLSWDPLIFKK